MQFHNSKHKVLIIDFGSQVTKLIARRVRELGVYSEIITPKELIKLKKFQDIKGIIFSGGPSTVTASKFQSVPKAIFKKKYQYWEYAMACNLQLSCLEVKLKPKKKKENLAEHFCLKKKSRF